MRAPRDWAEQDLIELVSIKQEEGLQLEFKRADALDPGKERNKTEISKDVSAFANSVGGTIVYGIRESSAKPHFAEAMSPIAACTCPKEWLEQIINSRIHPRIQGVLINCVELKSTCPGHFAYVVCIPASNTAHQASDRKYYKRFNFESVPMEDYEVRQTMNRTSYPAYQIRLFPLQIGSGVNRIEFRFACTIENVTEIVGRDVSAVIFAPREFIRQADDWAVDMEGISYSRIAGNWIVSSHDTRTAVDAAHPLTAYTVNFQKSLGFVADPLPARRFAAIVKVFDQFGLALTTAYFVGLPGLEVTLDKEIFSRRGAQGSPLP